MIPKALRVWFTVHFFVDLVFALPLIFAPGFVFHAFGLTMGDSLAPRLVGAAFLAIGTTSLVMKNAGLESYRALLNLKIIWSSSALIGILLALKSGSPAIAWLPFGIFVIFWVVWIYYRRNLSSDQRGLGVDKE